MQYKYNRFTFCPDDYAEKDSPYGKEEVNEVEMYDDMATLLRLLLKNGYQCHVWFDGYTTCFDFNYQDESISGVSLEWVGENEYVETYDNVGRPAEGGAAEEDTQ